MSIVVRVENVSKRYQLGTVGTKSLKDDFQRWWAKMQGKEDPFLKIDHQAPINHPKEFWALRDINFEIAQGDAIGIIGKNGAGKSTLLKILSRITAPTTGSVKVKGRIASLLEVGTGFNPDLTGRENVFLNGAILGMSKAEVRRKFDEIVDFSGIEQFIDTPVKRYSSGMYVRLAFAVAAHLESEILILDEVLAVGDAEFQKKCLGKMDDVAHKQGRTILFVSHSMPSVRQLCNTAIMLEKGEMVLQGSTDDIIAAYLRKDAQESVLVSHVSWPDDETAPGNEIVRLLEAEVIPQGIHLGVIDVDTPFAVRFKIRNLKKSALLDITFLLTTRDGIPVFTSSTSRTINKQANSVQEGVIETVCNVPGHLMNDGFYNVTVILVRDRMVATLRLDNVLTFEVVDDGRTRTGYTGKILGTVRPDLEWEYVQANFATPVNVVNT